MPERRSPTLRRRRLSAELRQLRAHAGMTLEQVAERLEFSVAKLRFIESAQWIRPNIGDVRNLLEVYGVTDEREREELLRLAREGRQKGWWQPYSKMLSATYTTYIGLEAEATKLLTYQPLIVPGLFQTEAYARALIQVTPDEASEKVLEDRVTVRMERQQILTGPDALSVWAVIDEAVLRRPIGGPQVMRAQLERLAEVARLPGVTLQLIPFAIGAHPGAGRGPFTILQFPEEADRDAVYVDNFAGELYVEERAEVSAFHEGFRHLVGVALSPADTMTFIAGELANS
ncbi:helix-turn-helix domain-containing protein [Actinoallomurus rhizosphaericola]|uniref:helix-turn-helix domain-containing protein n=1 Tax=Actinoallomurus rhizosphaericola TaxID=2952536 RepID=UPI00209367D5|nr:helix-turn-helix transcriptional regulator [Actinoallomurus rhizosphaericola]MCO5996197.1 helix-turn-helix domain-containing protein [Actinoallomurus rhizosphaericola]